MAKAKANSKPPKKSVARHLRFEDLSISVTYPVPGANANTAPFMVYGAGTPPANFSGQIVTGPGGLTLNGTAVAPGNLPAGATWGFTFTAPPSNTPLSLILADTSNPGTAVIIAFSISGPGIALGGVVTNQGIVTLTGTTTSTSAITAVGTTFVVEQPTSSTFAVTSHLPAGFPSATLQLQTQDLTGKMVRFPAIVFTVLANAPTATANQDPSGNNLIDVLFSNPMADTAFQAANYSLVDSSSNGVPISLVIPLDGQTAQLQTQNPLASDTYTLTIGTSTTPVTDQAGNAYDYTAALKIVVP